MTFGSFHRIAWLAFALVAGAQANTKMAELKSEARRGSAIALMHGNSADSGSIGAIGYLLAVDKGNWKKSAGFRLGFVVGAIERILTFRGANVSDNEKVLINGAFTIFSSEALVLKAQLRLTDSQMAQLFVREINGPRPFPKR